MERNVKIVGTQIVNRKNSELPPLYKIHYVYGSDKIDGMGADSVLVSDNFIKSYNPVVGSYYIAACYFDNNYNCHFAALYEDGSK